jgi:hypothetical protein
MAYLRHSACVALGINDSQYYNYAIILSVVMLSVITLNVIKLSAVATALLPLSG